MSLYKAFFNPDHQNPSETPWKACQVPGQVVIYSPQCLELYPDRVCVCACMYVFVYIYIYNHIYICICICIYIYICI